MWTYRLTWDDMTFIGKILTCIFISILLIVCLPITLLVALFIVVIIVEEFIAQSIIRAVSVLSNWMISR